MPNPLRVLHLEDSPRDADVIRHKLDAEGVSCDIILVGTKDEFEAALVKEPFDLVLSDYNLPGYDGVAALKHAQLVQPDVPVIIISGTVGEKEGVRCLHLGATDYLLKHSLDRLVPAVQRAIQEAETRRTRKRAEAALVDLRDAVNQHAIVAVTDTRGTITFVNDKFCEVSGYSREELVGQDHRLINSGHHSKEFMRDLWTTIKGGNTWHGEIKNKAKNGSFYWLDTTVVPFLNDDGTPRQYMAIRGVITERKEAELALRDEREALRTATERTRFALEAAGVGIWDMDYTSGVLGWSETLEVQYGLQPRTFGGTFEAFVERIHPDDRASVLETVGKAMKAGADFTVLNRSIWPDGTVRWLSGAGRIYLGAHGEPVRGVGISQDVTDRQQADETRARLAAIVESSADAIFSMAPDNTILTWNQGAERLYGYTANEAIGRSRALIVPAGKVAELTAIMERAARGEPGESFETQRMRKDGGMIDVSLTVSPLIDSTGRVTGAATIARDITSRLKADAELARLHNEIQLQRMRVFKATIRTVQDIVNNLLNGFQLVRLEGEGHLPVELLSLVDQMVQEAGVKLKTLGDLETVNETEMAIGMGIDYPGAGS